MPGDAIGDVMFSTMILRYYAGQANNIHGKSFNRDNYGIYNNQYAMTRKEPVGVCGLITPWNFPMLMSIFKIAPMLAAGCTGVIKPPENAPLSTIKIANLWNEIEGTIPGVLNCLPGLGTEAGEAMIGHDGIRRIAFTGSTKVGKRVMSRASGNMKRLSLELGGKGPCIIFDDANVDKAVEHITKHALGNAGQFCGAPTRIIVQDKVYDQFVEKLAKNYTARKVGFWRDEGNQMGPVITQVQLDKIMGYIKSGK